MANRVQFFCGCKHVDGAKFIEALRNLTINSFGSVELPITADEDALFSGFRALRIWRRLRRPSLAVERGPHSSISLSLEESG